MNRQLALGAIALVGCCLAVTPIQAGQTAAANEVRQVQFAERVITVELVRALSRSVREAREKCHTACPETGALELGIGLIGVSQSNVAADALIKLLGLRLDGAGSEELNCQIFVRGKALFRQLERLQPRLVMEHCQSIFLKLRKRELANVLDVNIEQVCRSETEIATVRDELLKALKSKVTCDQ
jgi:hypothetical protein